MVFIYLAGYAKTDGDYQQILASSSQLTDFNGCGDSYMTLNPDVVFANLKSSQSSLQAALLFSIASLLFLIV